MSTSSPPATSSSTSPPKPWELGNNATPNGSITTNDAVATTNANAPPAIPPRPNSLVEPGMYGSAPGTGYGYSSYSSPYNSLGSYGSYGSYGSPYSSYSSYSSPYSRMSPYGGGYSSYSSPYSRMSPYGGGLPFGGGMGMPPDPNNPSLMAQFQQSTASTFALIEHIVGAFMGFAQMLDSTFHATHSSFMAMVGVADHFGQLKQYFSHALGIVTLMSAIKSLINWVGNKAFGVKLLTDSGNAGISVQEFENFKPGSNTNSPSRNGSGALNNGNDKTNRKPLVVFLLLIFGIPYVMRKIIRLLQAQRIKNQALKPGDKANGNALLLGPDGAPLTPNAVSQLEFCRALFDFTAGSPFEISFRRGDIIAILSKVGPDGVENGDWWKGKVQSGPIGWFPKNYVEVVKGGNGSITSAPSNGTVSNGNAGNSPGSSPTTT